MIIFSDIIKKKRKKKKKKIREIDEFSYSNINDVKIFVDTNTKLLLI
jgi:hypothetical protein